jgi:hypothetical protein
MSVAPMSATSRRMRSIAGTRNSNPNGWSDGVPHTDSRPIQAAAPGRFGRSRIATLVATVTISPTPLGVNRPSAMPPRSQVGSVARPSWRSH